MEDKIQQLIKELEMRITLFTELLDNAIEDDRPLWEQTKIKGTILGFHQSLVLVKLLR